MTDSDSSSARRTHRNTRTDRRGRVGAARDAVTYAGPRSVAWTLTNPQQTRDKFTAFEWAILEARYPVIERWGGVRNSSVIVGRILGITGKWQMRGKAERRAHAKAYELCRVWAPAKKHWHDPPDQEDGQTAQRGRDRGARQVQQAPASGAPEVEEHEVHYQEEDVGAAVRWDPWNERWIPKYATPLDPSWRPDRRNAERTTDESSWVFEEEADEGPDIDALTEPEGS